MRNLLENIQILVIHVRGQKDREEFVTRQLQRLQGKAPTFSHQFVMDGNREDLTPEILDRYFVKGSPLHSTLPRTSCAYKHILATEYIIEHDLPGALIIEDDLRLYDTFGDIFPKCMEEYLSCHSEEPFMVNFEESSLMLVPRSQRREGQLLYPAKRDRFAGCYFLSRKAAEVICSYIRDNKSCYNSDELHKYLTEQGLISYYWSHPCIACQCSCDGSMPTMIPTKPRPFKRLKWHYKSFYKHLLYWFR